MEQFFVDRLTISSPDFVDGGTIPFELTADGGNAIPRLQWSGAPEGTVEFAIVCHDPDAPMPDGFTHWVVYGIPADATELDLSASGVRVGPNDAGVAVWFGPQPPHGHGDHRYYFWVFALSEKVDGSPTRGEFLASTAGDSRIEQARTVGISRRDM